MSIIKRFVVVCLLLVVSFSSFAERKKVGLVLSGGGAKGVAHVGVIKVLEEAGIPIDYVCGTSMGALVGALYAIGYDAAELDDIARNQNWRYLLSDQIDRSLLPVAAKEQDAKYLLSLPLTREGITVPSGMISGHNIQNLLTELTIGYHDSINFARLPIPFKCVAADVVSGDECVMGDGVLPTAMRASMAIPGVFAPVRLDSLVLVDGGIANNFPVDVCKDMGADIIIGVDLSTGMRNHKELNSVMSIIDQMTTVMGLRSYKENCKEFALEPETSLYMNPDLTGYSAASFTPVAIDTMILRGERVARQNWDKILKLKELVYEDTTPVEEIEIKPNKIEERIDSLAIGRIWLEGVGKKEEKWIRKFLSLKEYSVVTFDDIHQALAYLYGTGAFSKVNYQLIGRDIYELKLMFSKKSGSSLNFGFRFDTEQMASLLLNTTISNSYLRGSRISLTARLSSNPMVKVDYSFGNPFLRRMTASYQYRYNNLDWYQKGKKVDNVTFNYNAVQISFIDIYIKNLKNELGLRYEYFDYGQFLHAPGFEFEPARSKGYVTYFGSTQIETLDDKYYPNKGIDVDIDYSLGTTNFANNDGKSPFAAVAARVIWPIPLVKDFTFIPAFYGRVLIGQDIPYPYLNCMGGEQLGRYMPQQVPFVGIHKLELFDNSLLTLQTNFRYRLTGGHYVYAIANYAKQHNDLFKILEGNDIWGAGVKYSYKSLVGPIDFIVDWSNWSDQVGVYFNLGYYF